jgi:Tol biopolymer transport system component
VTKLHFCVLLGIALVLTACSSGTGSKGGYKIALVPDMAGQHGIFSINSNQTGGKLLTTDETAQLRPYSWAPDGRKIAYFSSRKEDSAITQKYHLPLHFPLHAMDSGGGNDRRLLDVPVHTFQWAPDGRRMLYVSAYEDPGRDDPDVQKGLKAPMSAAYLLDLETRVSRRVTDLGQNCHGSWSPDGRRLAFSFGDAQASDIYTATVDGKHTRRLTDTHTINIKPVWSPDGKRIAYISFVTQEKAIVGEAYVIEADGTSRRKISDVNPYEVSWSVDGKHLLLQSIKGITIASVDGSGTIGLRNTVLKPQDTVFTPDGRGVMFRSNHEGPWYLYMVDLNGDNIRRISGNLSASMFSLSPLK